MATVILTTAEEDFSMSTGFQDYFSLPPTVLPAKDSLTDISSRHRSPEWFLPKDLHDGLCIPSYGTTPIGHGHAEEERNEIIFPIFSPLRFIGKVEDSMVTENSLTANELTTEGSGCDSDSVSDSDWESDSDSDTDYASDTDSLPCIRLPSKRLPSKRLPSKRLPSNSLLSNSLPSKKLPSVSLLSNSNASTTPSLPQSPQPIKRAHDDSVVRMPATRSVDFLSHSWTVEDASSSRKEIRSNRGAYSNHVRLEYTLWRAWTKCKNNLKTIPPKSIEWEKEDDITWLYGPMVPRSQNASETPGTSADRTCQASQLDATSHVKPILKKPGLAEIMLERSHFNCSQLTRATSSPLPCGQVTSIRKIRVQWNLPMFFRQ